MKLSKTKKVPKASSHKAKKQVLNANKLRKGTPKLLPKNQFRDAAVSDRQLSKAIDKANEQKVAAKLIQDGGKLGLNDVMQKGKELNKETRRNQVKKKLGKVEEKLKSLEEKAEKEGLN